MNLDNRIQELGDRLERSVASELRARRAQAPTRGAARRRLPVVAVASLGVAAAGVAAVLVVGSGSGNGVAHDAGAHGVTGARGVAATPVSGAAQMRDTADIIRRIKARVAAGAGQGIVSENYDYSSGQVQPDGALTGLSAPEHLSWFYLAPDGAAFASALPTDATVAQAWETGNVVHGRYYSFALTVDRANHTYSLTQGMKSDPYANDGDNTGPGTALNEESPPSEVTQALKSGQATQVGTTTVNGTSALALKISLPAAQSAYEQEFLYVDAQTDQPLRYVNAFTATNSGQYQTGLYVSDWYPSTAANIAKAKDRTIPTGYTRVPDAVGNTGAGNTGN